MKRALLLVILWLILVTGVTCSSRELVSPRSGYLMVAHPLAPVTIRTRGLEGAGWIKALLPSGQWTLIHTSPSGSFTFNDVLPPGVWHCSSSSNEGCVAKLQAGDERGGLPTKKPNGAIFVCTEDYVQKVGRRHCGERTFEALSASGVDVPLDPWMTDIPNPSEYDSTIYTWQGDPYSRLIAGTGEFPYVNSWHPPGDVGATSTWTETPYEPGADPLVLPSLTNASYDIGACSIFFPWQWNDRIPQNLWTAAIGASTDNRGFAEIMLDGVIENATPETQLALDVFLWMDGVGGIYPREDVSPEFHFKIENPLVGPEGDPRPQMCLKNYFTASSDLYTGVDDWYRWDQGTLGVLTDLFNIGYCKHHPFSVFYCGTIGVDQSGNGTFNLSSEVNVSMEGYSVFKPSCNNRFVPDFTAAVAEGVRTVGAQNLDDGVKQLVAGISDHLDITVRRLEATPTGIYIVTAYSTLDPQYGVGNCLGDLEEEVAQPVVQPPVVKEYGSRGITRF